MALAEKYGTPLYVYDSKKIKYNFKAFKHAFSVPKLKVNYACKALSNISILRLMKSLGSGLDCVSIQEVWLGLRAGFQPKDILFTPNNISEEEYDLAVKEGVNITVDNIHMLEYFGINYPEVPVFIRINPHLMAGGNRKISVGHIDSKFGISIHQVPLIERIVKNLNIKVKGIHVHSGSDIIESQIFIRAAELIFSVVDHFDSVTHINFGSGFKVKYKPNDLYTNITDFGIQFSEVFKRYCKKKKKEYTLMFEPGKYMVSEAGFFLVNANVIKQTTACTFVGIDSGFNHFIRPMFYDAYHNVENVSNPNGDKKVYTLVGYICETDTFASDRILKEVRKNDILMFHNAGAYCYNMSSNYNSRFRPAEVLIHKGKDYLIRKREDFNSLIEYQMDPDFLK